MMICPACGAEQPDGNLTCSQCNADLTLLVQLENQALAHYHEGLRLARAEATAAAALDQFRLALALNPFHADSLVALGKLCAQRGAYQEAITAWQRVLELAPPESPAWVKARQGIDKAAALQDQERQAAAAALQDQEAAARSARRRRRFQLAAAAGLALVLGLALPLLFLYLPPRPSASAALLSKWHRSLEPYPHLRQAPLSVRVSPGGVVVAGELPSPRDRSQLEAASKQLRPIPVDISRVRVRPVADAAHLEQTLAAFTQTLNNPALKDRPYLGKALAGSRLTVTVADDGRLQVAGRVSLPEARQVLEDLCVRLAGPNRVDISGLELAPDFLVYQIQPGDTPQRLARRCCGDPRLWQEIRAFSPGNLEALKDPRRLRVGARVEIPRHLVSEKNRGAWQGQPQATGTAR